MSNQESAAIEESTEAVIEEAPQANASETPSDLSDGQAEAKASPSPDPPAAAPPEAAEPAASSADPPPAESELSPDSETSDSDGLTIHTLKVGQQITGKVKNITHFGAFVDIGIPQDGLVHISKLSRRKVDKVTDVLSEGQEIEVWVKKVDKKRGRISLTMIKPVTLRLKNIKEGAELEGKVTRLESYGAFVDIGSDRDGLVHISQITHDYIDHPQEALTVGDTIKVKVLKVNRKKRQVDLSIKALLTPPAPAREKVRKVEPEREVRQESSSNEPAPTAMALAYAAFQNWSDSDEDESDEDSEAGKSKKKEELDAIIARTLAARDE